MSEYTDQCPNCKQPTMPKWKFHPIYKDKPAQNARCCQNTECLHVEEREPSN